MKKIVSILVMLVLCLSLVACGSDEAPEGYQLVSGDDVAYRFYVPTQWSLNNSGDVDSAYYSVSDPAMVMVSFYMPDNDETEISKFWSAVEEKYKSTYTNYTLVSEQASTLGGRNAMAYTFTAGIAGTDYKVMQLITGYGNYFYTLTYMASPETFDSHLEAVNGMAGVFEFR
ncbi:MAG: hypothetical protein IJY27_06175 [Clostridia bacterium]|nr:hypothetical protein [Clostridia bacterium]